MPKNSAHLQDELRVACQASREVCWQRQGLIKAVGVQGLCAAQRCCQRLNGGADDVVVGFLRGEGVAAGLAVRPARVKEST
jgi:hypothetical protein